MSTAVQYDLNAPVETGMRVLIPSIRISGSIIGIIRAIESAVAM